VAQNNGKRTPPGLSHLFDCTLQGDSPQLIHTPYGTRTTVALTGGSVTGPALDGKILPGGGDWRIQGGDDLARVDVRLTIASDAGELVHCESGGVIDMPEDAYERLQAGRRIPSDEIYFRITPRFETGAPSLAWLNRIAAVGVGSLLPRGAEIEVYQVL
jgi:hypothetical protein